MGKVGIYRYPVRKIDDVANYLRRIWEAFPEGARKEEVAETIGMSPTSGGFFIVLSSMKIYGLIETGMGRVQITELGRRACSPDPKEARLAKAEAIMRVPLFRELNQRFGADINGEDLIGFLKERAGVSTDEALKKLRNLLHVYQNAALYLEGSARNRGLEETEERGEIEVPEQEKGTIKIQVKTEDLILSKIFPFDKESIASAKKLLSFLESQIKDEDG